MQTNIKESAEYLSFKPCNNSLNIGLLKRTFQVTILVFLSSLFSPLQGQYFMNLATTISPERSITQKIGYTKVSITYSSPSVKGRTIWGELEPYDQVWRAGANYATKIEFSENIVINDQIVPKGEYSFFLIPRKEQKWTVILNSRAKQWGAFNYDSTKNVIQIDLKVNQYASHQENLLYDIASSDSRNGVIILKWEKLELRIPFQTDLNASLNSLLEQNLENAENHNRWIVYLQSAEILLNENESLDNALSWIDQAEELSAVQMEWNKQFYPKEYILGHLYWTKAKILSQLNRQKEALTYANKMMELSNDKFYSEEKEFEKIDQLIEEWSKY